MVIATPSGGDDEADLSAGMHHAFALEGAGRGEALRQRLVRSDDEGSEQVCAIVVVDDADGLVDAGSDHLGHEVDGDALVELRAGARGYPIVEIGGGYDGVDGARPVDRRTGQPLRAGGEHGDDQCRTRGGDCDAPARHVSDPRWSCRAAGRVRRSPLPW